MNMWFIFALAFRLFAMCALGYAAPIQKGETPSEISMSQISAFQPFSFFASAAYCSPSSTLSWTCGASCNGDAGFIPMASGGNGDSVQFWYVGFSPAQNSVIVAHEGTVPTELLSIATDIDAFQKNPDATLFPGLSPSIMVHSGFADEHASTAEDILSAVIMTLSIHSSTNVTIVGHSLGAAIALLDGVYLPLHITGISFRVIGYGLPRVGNQAFADYVDAHLSLTHINNLKDPIPTVPGEFLGYVHPAGELHIVDGGPSAWVSCPGQDNPSIGCSVADVPNIFDGTLANHDGPYNGVIMGEGC